MSEYEYTCNNCGHEGYNTRAVPDVPELVRYYAVSGGNMMKHDNGDYVLYSQAAEIIAAKDEEIERLREALKPFAMYMKNNGDGRIDLNNKNDPLPDTDTVGWVYLTYKDFRMAEGALGEGNA